MVRIWRFKLNTASEDAKAGNIEYKQEGEDDYSKNVQGQNLYAAEEVDEEELKNNPDVKEFYMGLTESGSRKSFKNIKSYKRRKRWMQFL